jgi:multiple RNA-binding domain-containing protein 1
LVQFESPSSAVDAYHNLDGEPFQGRLLHILPAAAKRDNKLDEFAISKLPLKKQKQIKKKAEASSSTFNWNSLYMNQDAVNSSIADRLGVSKAELLDPTSADAGVKQAIAETSIIQETKAYFAKNGVDLDAFKRKERGDTAILVKNFPYGMSLEELRRMFEDFGTVLRVLMPPTGTIAIVEFAQPPQARAAFASLAYRRIKDSVLFLEKAPKDLFTGAAPISATATGPTTIGDTSVAPKLSASDLLERESIQDGADTSTLFVRNLNFTTTSARLTEIFKPLDGFMSARVNTKTDPKKPGQVLSMGFGFLEFRSKAQAQAALTAMDGYNLDNHKLIIKASHRGVDAAEERRKEDKAKKLAGMRTKIIVKNLPFEATKKDIRSLLGTYGQLRSVRVPKKFDSSARGFAFAEFVTAREAENALEALKDTHLLGRRLVLEFAADDPADAEEEIEKMQKKVGRQVNKVALQNLTGGGRKKFTMDGGDNEEE